MITEEEFVAVKEEIAKAIEKLPDTALVGLITFNKFVHVHELTAKINTVYCVSGSKDYTNVQVLDVLGLQIKNDPRGVCHDIAKKFLVPIGNNREKITKRIKDVKIDQLIYVNERPLRATSAAINIAITLAESSPVVPRIITFIGGPCTIGTGKIIEQSFEKMMRTQNDIYKGENCENYNRASKYYDLLTKRLVAKKIVLDIFGFCLDQFGLL
jgi:protein transport protein SEC23